MQLRDFYDYKNQLAEDLLTDEEMVGLIKENVSMSEATSLMYKNVFPYEYVPETVQTGDTYVCIDIDVQTSMNKTYLLPTIYVWVFAHRSNLRLPEGGVRTDAMCSRICELINGSRKYGMGELELHAVKRFAPMTDYQGKVMIFYAKEWNAPYDPNKYTPSNRKKN